MSPPSKRIVIDARMLGPTGHGIGNYVLDLAEALKSRSLPFELFYLLGPDCPPASLLREFPHRESSVPFLHPLEAWRLPAEIAETGAAAFHSPSFMSLARYPCPHLQTVHDLNHLHYGGLFHRAYYRFLLLPSLRSARTVIAVSESGRGELQRWLTSHHLSRSVELAENAIPEPAAADIQVLKKLGLESDGYFFCLSNPKPHKNVAMLEAAHRDAGMTLPLVVNVPGPGRAGLVRTGSLSAGEISALYAHARAYFFPSLYEGFGRSPLEATLAGTAPVASDIPSHREVLTGVREAELLPPAEAGSWTQAFRRLAQRPKIAVSDASRAWVRGHYSRQKLGDKMEKIYAEVLSAPVS